MHEKISKDRGVSPPVLAEHLVADGQVAAPEECVLGNLMAAEVGDGREQRRLAKRVQ